MSKQMWSIIIGLILLNIVTVLYFTLGPDRGMNGSETIAKIGDEEISRADWMEKLESLYGKETLKGMVNEEVVRQAAKKHHISITEKEFDNEWKLQQSLYGSIGNTPGLTSDKELKRQLESSILLEKLLTEEVNIPNKSIKAYYEKNKNLYDIPDAYRLSHIVVKTKKEAEAILSELKEGSAFDVLAMERSQDDFTANKGGDLGYVVLDSETIPREYSDYVKLMKKNEWKGPVKTEEGYAILYLSDQIKGSKLTYKEIKPTLKRQMAMEQMNTSASAEMFWDEIGVDWFYGK